MEISVVNELRDENVELKRTLSLLLNHENIRELTSALDRINSGEYVSEQEFFKNSPQEVL